MVLKRWSKYIWDKLEIIDQYALYLTGYNVIHFPFFVRKNCYICNTLKPEVISQQNKEIKKAFNKTIPGLLATAGRDKLNRGKRLLNESVQTHSRKSKHIK
jgi:hypothetical protein